MIGPAGVLVLSMVTAMPPDPTDYAWARAEATEVVPASYYGDLPRGTSPGLARLAPQPEAPPAGVAFAYDHPVTQVLLQDIGPVDEEPGTMPRPDPISEPPAPMPLDPAYQDAPAPPDEQLPFKEESPFKLEQPEPELLPEEALWGETCAEDACCDFGGTGSAGGGGGVLGEWLWGISFESWIAQGLTINTDSPRNRSNFPVGFNDRSNDYQMNQFYVLLERPVDEYGYHWDIGGRVDLLYGTDQMFTTARGLETHRDLSPKWNSIRYGLAMPQAYAEVYVPWGSGLSMKLGHFYTTLGYETVPAVENFFYSRSYAKLYGEPFTHTGFLGSTRLGNLTVSAGMTRGWDNWEDNNNDFAFLGGVGWTSYDGRSSIAFDIHVGRERDEPPSSTNVRTVHSLVVQHWMNSRVLYVAQYDHGFEREGAAGGRDADWFGLNQYLFYTINPWWKLGVRYEWFRDEDATRITPVLGGDYFNVSVGLNWTPNERIIVRPEFRWDWVDTPGYYPFGDGFHDQIVLDLDVIMRF